MGALSLSLMLVCVTLGVVVGELLRRRQPAQPHQRRRGPVIDTTQRLGVFGFAQCNVIYDYYQKEVNLYQRDVNALETRWRTHRSLVAGAFGHSRRTWLSLGQMPWRETFRCDALQPILARALPELGLAAYLDYHEWNPTWTSALGWSTLQIASSDPRAPSAFHVGQYGSVIALNAPIPQATMDTGLRWTYERNLWSGLITNGDCIQNDVRIRILKTPTTR